MERKSLYDEILEKKERLNAEKLRQQKELEAAETEKLRQKTIRENEIKSSQRSAFIKIVQVSVCCFLIFIIYETHLGIYSNIFIVILDFILVQAIAVMVGYLIDLDFEEYAVPLGGITGVFYGVWLGIINASSNDKLAEFINSILLPIGDGILAGLFGLLIGFLIKVIFTEIIN